MGCIRGSDSVARNLTLFADGKGSFVTERIGVLVGWAARIRRLDFAQSTPGLAVVAAATVAGDQLLEVV